MAGHRSNQREAIRLKILTEKLQQLVSHWLDAHPWGKSLKQYPLIFLVGFWGIVLLFGGLATVSLIHVEPFEQHETLADTDRLRARQNQGSLPVWSLGLIAFSCAIGSMMIAQRLNQNQHPPRLLKHASSSAVASGKK
jgi:hypothetical protein